MRERHFPRLCRSCDSPMARQEGICWRCETVWDYRLARANVVRVRPGGHAARPDAIAQPSASAVSDLLHAIAQARLDLDRVADEGGGVAVAESRRLGAQIAGVR